MNAFSFKFKNISIFTIIIFFLILLDSFIFINRSSNNLKFLKNSTNQINFLEDQNLLNINMKLDHLMNLIRQNLQQSKKFKIKELTIEKRVYSIEYLTARDDLLEINGPNLDKKAKKEFETLLKFYQLENTKYKATKIHLAVQRELKTTKLKLLKNSKTKVILKIPSNNLKITTISENQNLLNMKLAHLMNLIRQDLQQLKKFRIKELTIKKNSYSVKYLIARIDLQTINASNLDKEAKTELQSLLHFYQLENTKYRATEIHLAVKRELKTAKLKLLKPKKIINNSNSDL